MFKSPAFTQVATVTGHVKYVYVGGQNAVDIDGKIVGSDIKSQSEQTFKNVIMALEAAGATLNDVFKMTIYIVQGHSLQDAYAAASALEQPDTEPSTVSVIQVAGLANPDALIEIEAVAAVDVK
jgi:enamine deaminase RidA (YjgF/YER057c/UK114 family)